MMFYGQILVLWLIYGIPLLKTLQLWYLMHGVSIMIIARFPNHRIDGTWTEGDHGATKDFGEHILKTSFDHNYWMPPILSIFLTTGFNNHIAHHLFPSVCISKLYLLRDVIRDTCKQFGLEKNKRELNYRDMYVQIF
jgi:fatty acid desaturase